MPMDIAQIYQQFGRILEVPDEELSSVHLALKTLMREREERSTAWVEEMVQGWLREAEARGDTAYAAMLRRCADEPRARAKRGA